MLLCRQFPTFNAGRRRASRQQEKPAAGAGRKEETMRVTTTIAAAVVAALPGAALAQEVNLSFAHWLPATHPLHVTGFEPWVQSIEEASDGRIAIDIFPARQLGAAADHYDMARDGIADITWVNPGYQPGRFPVIAAGELPLHVLTATSGSRALDEWYADYALDEMRDVYVCNVHMHDPGTFHSKVPVRVPSDIEGRNVRPAHATMARFVALLGGASVQVSAPEAREAIARGAADMITFPWESIYIFGIDQEVSHHLDTKLYATTFAIVMNEMMVESLPPDLRQVIDEHCNPEWAERMATGWAEVEAEGRQKMADDPEHLLYAPSAEELDAWKAAAAPLVEEWKTAVAARDVDADEAYEAFVAKLKEHDAFLETGE
jgi:TRAP-type C4-dicarboxylate transport system substrate-binding protein